jgi:hypothetical protein
LPGNAPWDPIPARYAVAPASKPAEPAATSSPLLPRGVREEPAPATVDARKLQSSAIRRIWSTLWDSRDWISYVYVPILVPILTLLPYFVGKTYERSHRLSQLVESLSQGSRDLEVMTRLLEGPMPPFTGEPADEARDLGTPNFAGFEVLQDSRIIDMRTWNPTATGKLDTTSLVYGYRRLKVLKRHDNKTNNIFRIGVLTTHPNSQIRFPPQLLQGKLRASPMPSTPSGEKQTGFQASWNFEKVPAGEYVDLIYEHYSPAIFLQRGDVWSSVAIHMQADTAEVTRWFLMPQGKEYKTWRIVRYQNDKPETAEPVKIVTEYLADDNTILAYKLMSTDGGYTYEVIWYYK